MRDAPGRDLTISSVEHRPEQLPNLVTELPIREVLIPPNPRVPQPRVEPLAQTPVEMIAPPGDDHRTRARDGEAERARARIKELEERLAKLEERPHPPAATTSTHHVHLPDADAGLTTVTARDFGAGVGPLDDIMFLDPLFKSADSGTPKPNDAEQFATPRNSVDLIGLDSPPRDAKKDTNPGGKITAEGRLQESANLLMLSPPKEQGAPADDDLRPDNTVHGPLHPSEDHLRRPAEHLPLPEEFPLRELLRMHVPVDRCVDFYRHSNMMA